MYNQPLSPHLRIKADDAVTLSDVPKVMMVMFTLRVIKSTSLSIFCFYIKKGRRKIVKIPKNTVSLLSLNAQALMPYFNIALNNIGIHGAVLAL